MLGSAALWQNGRINRWVARFCYNFGSTDGLVMSWKCSQALDLDMIQECILRAHDSDLHPTLRSAASIRSSGHGKYEGYLDLLFDWYRLTTETTTR